MPNEGEKSSYLNETERFNILFLTWLYKYIFVFSHLFAPPTERKKHT